MKVLSREGKRAVGFREFASMFSVSADTVKRLARTGALRTIRVGARRLITIAEIERVERDGLEPVKEAK